MESNMMKGGNTHISWCLSNAPQAVPVEKNLPCGEITPHDIFSCTKILQMTIRQLEKCLHMVNKEKDGHVEKFLHVRNVETNLFWIPFTLFCQQIYFVAINISFCVETNWTLNFVCGEKKYKYQVWACIQENIYPPSDVGWIHCIHSVEYSPARCSCSWWIHWHSLSVKFAREMQLVELHRAVTHFHSPG